MKQLIITGDDFGAAREINEAVETSHRSGILTSASLMVGAPATLDAVVRARRNPSLRVGLHLVLVDGRPVLPAAAIPALVDVFGNFRSNMVGSGAQMFFSTRARRQLAAEIYAQFDAFRRTGLALDHCNSHKHFHLHPTVANLIVQIGREFGLYAARVPAEPPHVLARVEPNARLGNAWATMPWAYLLRRRLRAAGMLVPDQVFGLHWSGAMTKERLLGLICGLPEGLSEIYVHPATARDFPGAKSGYRYIEEFEAILAPEVVYAARRGSVELGGFFDFRNIDGGKSVQQRT